MVGESVAVFAAELKKETKVIANVQLPTFVSFVWIEQSWVPDYFNNMDFIPMLWGMCKSLPSLAQKIQS